MKKRIMAILLAGLMLISALTGCSSKEANYFFQLSDEMLALEDSALSLSIPYHGAQLEVSGFISKSERKADLLLSISGTEENDGPLTELRVDGSQVWLNVRQLAEATLEFDLYDYYRGDIEDLYDQQFADWVIYIADERLWEGIPGWGELLLNLWDDTKADIKGSISGNEQSAVLAMNEQETAKLLAKTGERLLEQYDSYQEGFLTFADQELEFFKEVELDAYNQFETWVAELETLMDELDAGEASVTASELTLSKDGEAYLAELKQGSGDTWSLRLEPSTAGELERPYSVMEFEGYGSETFFLVTFSNTYIGNMLSGVELDQTLQSAYESEQGAGYYREDMTTGTVAGYDDLASIQFVPEGGVEMTVPILPNFLGNSVTTVADGLSLISDLSLDGVGWSMYIYSQESQDKNPKLYLEDMVYNYYDNFISISGFQLVQDLSELKSTANGSAMAQGFSYRTDNYSDAVAMIHCILLQDGCTSYTLIELTIELSEITESDKVAVLHLFESLGLECPVDLDYQ